MVFVKGRWLILLVFFFIRLEVHPHSIPALHSFQVELSKSDWFDTLQDSLKLEDHILLKRFNIPDNAPDWFGTVAVDDRTGDTIAKFYKWYDPYYKNIYALCVMDSVLIISNKFNSIALFTCASPLVMYARSIEDISILNIVFWKAEDGITSYNYGFLDEGSGVVRFPVDSTCYLAVTMIYGNKIGYSMFVKADSNGVPRIENLVFEDDSTGTVLKYSLTQTDDTYRVSDIYNGCCEYLFDDKGRIEPDGLLKSNRTCVCRYKHSTIFGIRRKFPVRSITALTNSIFPVEYTAIKSYDYQIPVLLGSISIPYPKPPL